MKLYAPYRMVLFHDLEYAYVTENNHRFFYFLHMTE